MALAPLDIIMLLGTGILGAAPMIGDLFPKKDTSNLITTCKVVAGTRDTEDGDLPALHLFDREGSTIGISEGESSGPDSGLGRGGIKEVRIQQLNQQHSIADLAYMSVVNGGNDAACIAMISCTTPSGLVYAFSGDIAQQCDGVGDVKVPWFYGNKSVAQPAGQPELQPACVWVDGDATNGLTTQGIGIHMESFRSADGREADFQQNRKRMCNSKPRFNVYEKMDSFDTIPFFKESPFDATTLVDIGDKALDQNNWDTKPIDFSDLIPAGAFFKKREAPVTSGTKPGNAPLPAGGAANTQPGQKSSNANDKTTTNNAKAAKNREGTNPGSKKSTGQGATQNAQRGRVQPPTLVKQSSTARRPYPKQGRLIMSGHQEHSAKKLCSSKGSWGPDFYSKSEGFFCDMTQKKAYPVCPDTVGAGAGGAKAATGAAAGKGTNTKGTGTSTNRAGKADANGKATGNGGKATGNGGKATGNGGKATGNGNGKLTPQQMQNQQVQPPLAKAGGNQAAQAGKNPAAQAGQVAPRAAPAADSGAACFDAKLQKVRPGKGKDGKLRRRDLDGLPIPRKVYNDVQMWVPEN